MHVQIKALSTRKAFPPESHIEPGGRAPSRSPRTSARRLAFRVGQILNFHLERFSIEPGPSSLGVWAYFRLRLRLELPRAKPFAVPRFLFHFFVLLSTIARLPKLF